MASTLDQSRAKQEELIKERDTFKKEAGPSKSLLSLKNKFTPAIASKESLVLRKADEHRKLLKQYRNMESNYKKLQDEFDNFKNNKVLATKFCLLKC
jgi:molecular chaperone GrpE (heat shock protein)